MAFGVYVQVDGTDDEIAAVVARVLAVRPRAPTDTRAPIDWLRNVLTDVLEEYLRNAAAIAARQSAEAPVRLSTAPPARSGPDWNVVSGQQPPVVVKPIKAPAAAMAGTAELGSPVPSQPPGLPETGGGQPAHGGEGMP